MWDGQGARRDSCYLPRNRREDFRSRAATFENAGPQEKSGRSPRGGGGGESRPFGGRSLLGCGLLGGERLGGGDLLGLGARLLGVQHVALSVVELAGAHAGVLGDAGRLAAAVAQVIELGAADLAAAHDLDGLDQRRVDREDALDALAVGNLANREVLLEARAGAGDADALIGLDAGARTFGDAHLDADRVARLEFGERALGFDLGGLFGLELTDDVHLAEPFFVLAPARAPALADQFVDRPAMLPMGGKQGRIHVVLVAVPGFPDFRLRRYTITRGLSPQTGDFVAMRGCLRPQ